MPLILASMLPADNGRACREDRVGKGGEGKQHEWQQ